MLEILARVITAAEGEVNFAHFILNSGISIPSGTKVMVVTPPLRETQTNSLLSVRRRGYELEVFLTSSYLMKKEDTVIEGIKSHTISAYGTEIVNE